MTNKKAIAVNFLIGTIIAVAILVIIFWMLFLGGKETIVNWFDRAAPSYNSTQPRVEDTEILGYNLQTGAAEYYTGVEWVNFQQESKVTLNNKEILYATAQKDFEDYYYNVKERTENTMTLSETTSNSLYENEQFPNNFCLTFTNLIFRKDIISAQLFEQQAGECTNKFFGLIEIESGQRIYFTPIDEETYMSSGKKTMQLGTERTELFTPEIITLAQNWDSSITKNPITLHYTENMQPRTQQFCVEKIPERLVVRLDKPATACT